MTAYASDANLEYVITRARELQKSKEYASSTKLLDRYIDFKISNPTRKDSTNIVLILCLQADNFYNLGVTTRAAELYENALKISDAMGNKRKSAEICNTLFILHLFTGNNALSKDLLSKALKLYRQLGDSVGVCKILNNIGIMNFTQEDFPSSLIYYNKALEISGDDKEIKSRILTNMAKTFVMQGDLDKADKYLEGALNMMGRRYDDSDALQAWINKAEVLALKGKNSQARSILDIISGKIKLRDQDRIIESCNQMAEIRLAIGDSIEALRWILRTRKLSDSLNVKRENDQLRQILVRYNSERIADQNKLLELTTKRQFRFIVMLVILTILVIGFAAFLFYKMRSDRKKNLLISQQNEQIMAFEQLEHERKEKEYQEQLDQKNRQLTSYSIDASSIGELHKIVLESLKKLHRHANATVKDEIDENIARLQNYNRTELADDFRVHFNDVHPDFTNRLSEKYPILTTNDLRLCSYIYLGMSTKEIAALTFREIRSVESSRLRLRKKLGLEREQTLHNFLQNVIKQP